MSTLLVPHPQTTRRVHWGAAVVNKELNEGLESLVNLDLTNEGCVSAAGVKRRKFDEISVLRV